VHRGKSRLLITLTLASLIASGIVAAPRASASNDPHAATITLAAETQPKIHRPTLERLKAESAAKGTSLQEAIRAYIDEKAKTDPAATANWPDGPVDLLQRGWLLRLDPLV
jgi:DNA-binding PucR family transcriptional regulator